MTVLDNVMVGAFLRHPHRNDAREHARQIVELTGLRPLSPTSAPRSLGTPGRKRLEIARVLATEPRLMLLDESLAGLTPTELQEAIALVRRIHEMGITIVIVEHIMEVIMTLTKRVLVFNQGHVIASGKPEDIVGDEAVIEAYLGRGHRKRRERRTVSDSGRRASRGALRRPGRRGRRLAASRARAGSWRCSAPTAPARPRRSTPSPAWCGQSNGRSSGDGEAIAGQPAYAIVRKGLALSPEGWRLFVSQTVEQNLRLGATRACATSARIEPCSSASTRCSRALPSGVASAPARCPAASARCWRSAAR